MALYERVRKPGPLLCRAASYHAFRATGLSHRGLFMRITILESKEKPFRSFGTYSEGIAEDGSSVEIALSPDQAITLCRWLTESIYSIKILKR